MGKAEPCQATSQCQHGASVFSDLKDWASPPKYGSTISKAQQQNPAQEGNDTHKPK